jgi:hypothetical protein
MKENGTTVNLMDMAKTTIQMVDIMKGLSLTAYLMGLEGLSMPMGTTIKEMLNAEEEMGKESIALEISSFMDSSKIMFYMEKVNKREVTIALKEIMNMEQRSKEFSSSQAIFTKEALIMITLKAMEL